MTTTDLAVLLVAGVIGAGEFWPFSQRVAWGIVGLWALLRLLKVL